MADSEYGKALMKLRTAQAKKKEAEDLKLSQANAVAPLLKEVSNDLADIEGLTMGDLVNLLKLKVKESPLLGKSSLSDLVTDEGDKTEQEIVKVEKGERKLAGEAIGKDQSLFVYGVQSAEGRLYLCISTK